MARFDVYEGFGGGEFLLDCQSNLLADMQTRFVVPLRPVRNAPPPIRRLNPVFQIGGDEFVMMTQQAATIPKRECGPIVATLAAADATILNALDMLISGY
ncbi:CcdB family protein [Sandarakinorhabdus sp.]|uniref:CcdB family protein n=1 Tax=Sandarakinorhabdus sp. TaxID=1916663 RepID=UPI00333E1B69